MLRRRDFLKSSLLAASPFVPVFLQRAARAATPTADSRKLVVIQLSGGNDGLNTVIPFADANYAKHRRTLRIDTDKVLRLNDSLGLHPAMQSAADLYHAGRLAIIPGVGYPNPNRSHFESMAIWHSGRPDAPNQQAEFGWLGRAADDWRRSGTSAADAIFVGDASMPKAILGRKSVAIALDSEQDLRLALPGSSTHKPEPGNDLSAFVSSTIDSSFAAALKLAESSKTSEAELSIYPTTRLGQRLKLIAKLLRMDLGAPIFYVDQPGYDTHSAQSYGHERLLRELSAGLKSFLDDLQQCGLVSQVTILAFSEFGRRAAENDSAGTDHGTAGPVFLAGAGIQPGLHGQYPSLADLDSEGDLIATTDFRSIYASILSDWLRVHTPDQDPPPMSLFRDAL